MKKSSLAIATTPALLASFLLSAYPAQANTNQRINTNQDGEPYISSVVITKDNDNSGSNRQDNDDRTNILNSDRVGDLAIIQRGCDCKGCRQAVLSLFSK
jgi:hypothetical protein